MKKISCLLLINFFAIISIFAQTENPTGKQQSTAASEQGPNADCKCGKWSSITVRESPIVYQCGGTVEWKCKKPFSFSANYQCVPTNPRCQAKTNWTIKKDGILIKSGTSGSNISDAFTPTENGNYTITLNAVCGSSKCEPCIMNMVVRDCDDAICDCSNDMYVMAKMGGQNLKIRCGETKDYKEGSTVVLVPENICSTPKCTGQWNMKVYNAQTGALVSSGSGAGNSSSLSLLLSLVAGYRIELTTSCGNKKCTCTFYIRTRYPS